VIVLTRTRRVDWPRLILDLRRTGLSLPRIGQGAGVSARTIGSYLTTDTEPAHWTGEALIGFWVVTTGRQRGEAPVRAVVPSVAAVMRGG